MSEWKDYKLGDVLVIKNGKSRPKSDGNIPIYGGNGILGYSNEYNIEKETLIIGRVGAYCGAIYFENNQIWVSDNALFAKPKKDDDIKYLYYHLKLENLNKYAEGSSHPLLTQGRLNNLDITIPDLQTQTAIAEILSSLDDKIELNNKINQELESLAQALFNLICVVDEAQDNDGWRTIKLKDVLSIKNGYAFKGMDFIESGIPVIKIKNVKAGKINFNNLSYVSENIANKAEKFKIKKYDLLITMSGNRIDGSMDTWVGKVGMFPKKGEYLLNQRVSILKLDNIKLKYYLLQLLSSEEYQYHFISNATSSGGQANISPDLINNTEILLPPTEKIEIFESVASDIYSIIFNNMSENESLIELRDTLLPKLISGELEINEINN